MKIIKPYIVILLVVFCVKVNISWAQSADLLYLESRNLFYESRFDADKLDLALDKINQAIQIERENVNYLSLLGSICLLKKDYDNALKSYQQALELDPGNPYLISQMGDVKAFQNKLEQALVLYDEALRLDSKNWRTYQNRGYLLYLQNKRDRALDDFNRAIKLNPKALYAYNNRGVLQYEMENFDSALADFSEVEKLDPNSPIPSFYQGQYLEHKGDFVAAAEKYKTAIDIAKDLPLYPVYPEAKVALGRVSAMLN